MHALSPAPRWIPITSVLEWAAAMLAVRMHGRQRSEGCWHRLATVGTVEQP